MTKEAIDQLCNTCYKLLDPIGEDFSAICYRFPVAKEKIDSNPNNVSNISIVEVKRNSDGGLRLHLDYTADVFGCDAMATEWIRISNSIENRPNRSQPATAEDIVKVSSYIENLLANQDSKSLEIKSFAGRNSLFEYFGVDIQNAEKPFCGTRG